MTKHISRNEFFEVIDSVEKTLIREDWKVSGVDVWPIIKIYYSYFVLTQLLDKRDSQIRKFQGKASKALRILVIIFKFLSARFVDKSNNDKLRKADLLIFVQSSTRYFRNSGFWYSPYSDTLQAVLNKVGIKSLVCETTEDAKFLFPRFGSSLLIQQKLIFNMVIAKIKSIIYSSKIEQCANWEKFAKIIKDRLGHEFLPDASKINYQLNNFFQQRPYFLKLLHSADCKVCVMSGYYSSTMFALINACRAVGVKTVEIQHGVQGEAHLAYRSWHKLPDDDTCIMPDYFWTWTAREKEVIDGWTDSASGRRKAFVGGNPCLTIYNKSGCNIVGETDYESYKFSSGNVSKVVLFTCQAFDRIPEAVIKAIRLRPDYGWIFRIHPQYWNTEKSIKIQCESEGFRNVIVDNGEILPLGSAMMCSTVHMTEFSSSVIEAAVIGLHSIIINPYGRDLYSDIIKAGKASYVEGPDSILEIIESISPMARNNFAALNENELMIGASKILSIIRG